VKANHAYRMRINAATVTDNPARRWTGITANSDGDGKAGGNFQFFVKNDTSTLPSVKFYTRREPQR